MNSGWVKVVATVHLVAAMWTGCSVLSVPETPPVSSPLFPVWNTKQIRRHLTFLHDRSVRGRVDGTVGYGVAASYVAERLEDYGLQPATAGDFRLLFTTPRNLVRASRVRIGSQDSVSLRPGVDFQPDGRTGSAVVAISGLGIITAENAWDGPAVPLLWQGQVSSDELGRYRDLGVPVVLTERDTLVPRPAPRPISGLGVLELTSGALDLILAGSHPMDGAGPGILRLRQPVKIEIIAEYDEVASGINVVGFVPGKDPVLSRDAVLVVTHLDAIGSFGGAEYLDLRDYGVEVAALLDVARQFSSFSRLAAIPERTLIVALVGGGTIDSGGFMALLRQPLWEMERVRSIIYVGAPLNGPDQIVKAGNTYTGRLHFVTAADSIPKVIVPLPSKTDSGPRRRETRQVVEYERAQSYLPMAIVATEELAQRLYQVVGTEVMGRPDTAASVED